MAKKVLFYNGKGGVGKTTLAVNYAIRSKSDFYTNDPDLGTADHYQDIIERTNSFYRIAPNDEELEVSDKAVFDFGGGLDPRLLNLIKHLDLCVIPIRYKSVVDITSLLKMVDLISEHNTNIAIVINDTKKKWIEGLKAQLEKAYKGKIPVFIVSESEHIAKLPSEKKTVDDLANEFVLFRHSTKSVREQFDKLFNYIMEY